MKIISPRSFDPAKITTNVPIDEVEWTVGTYTKGARRYVMPSRDLYEVVVASTDDEPTLGAARKITDDALTNVPTWALVGKINAYACFDNKLRHATTFADGFDMTIASNGTVCDGLCIFNVSGGFVRITVEDPVEGVIYDETLTTVDLSNIRDFNDWHFAPIIRKPDLILTDLPLFSSASVRIRIDGAGAIGEVVLGRVTVYGVSLFGTEVSTYSFSKKEYDIFGDAIVLKRGTAKRANFLSNIPSKTLAHVQDELAALDAVPTVFIGTEEFTSTVLFGFYRDFSVVLAGPSTSKCNIRIEGLV